MANVPTVAHNETTPAGTDYIREGDDRIREFKIQAREIVAVDHMMTSAGQGATWGMHKWCTFIEAADIGSGAAGLPILGAQTTDAKPELTYVDEDDNDIQLTKAGKSYAGLLDDGATFDTSAAPTVDAGVANKKYVDDQIPASQAAAKGWINFNGATATERDSYNVSSITDLGTGEFTIVWDTDFANDDYAVGGMTNGLGDLTAQYDIKLNFDTPQATTGVSIVTMDGDAGRNWAVRDYTVNHVVAFGDR